MSQPEERELAIQVIGCMVEVLADEEGNIDQKCFEKIFNACIKAVIVAAKVGDQALMGMEQSLQAVVTPLLLGGKQKLTYDPICTKVGWHPSESFKKDFKDGLLDKIKSSFPLVRHHIFQC